MRLLTTLLLAGTLLCVPAVLALLPVERSEESIRPPRRARTEEPSRPVADLVPPDPTTAARVEVRARPPRASAGPRSRDPIVRPLLDATGGIAGRVLDEDGAPAAAFELAVRRILQPDSAALGALERDARITLGEQGTFAIRGLRFGTYVVQATARDRATSFSECCAVRANRIIPDVEVRLSRGGTLRGEVVDRATGAPMPGVKVSTHFNRWFEGGAFICGARRETALTVTSVITDTTGHFEIPTMTPETYQVRLEASGSVLQVLDDIEVGGERPKNLGRLRLRRGGIVRGTVVLEAGFLVGGARVRLVPRDSKLLYHGRSLEADAEGRFSFEGVAPGSYRLCSARPAAEGGSPLQAVVDMEKSRCRVRVGEGRTLVRLLRLPEDPAITSRQRP